MKQEYTVNLHFDAIKTIVVNATSEKEAVELALDIEETSDEHRDFDIAFYLSSYIVKVK